MIYNINDSTPAMAPNQLIKVIPVVVCTIWFESNLNSNLAIETWFSKLSAWILNTS